MTGHSWLSCSAQVFCSAFGTRRTNKISIFFCGTFIFWVVILGCLFVLDFRSPCHFTPPVLKFLGTYCKHPSTDRHICPNFSDKVVFLRTGEERLFTDPPHTKLTLDIQSSRLMKHLDMMNSSCSVRVTTTLRPNVPRCDFGGEKQTAVA